MQLQLGPGNVLDFTRETWSPDENDVSGELDGVPTPSNIPPHWMV